MARRAYRAGRRRPRINKTKRGFIEAGKDVASAAYQGYRLAKWVAGMLNVEYKWVETQAAGQVIDTATVIPLSKIAQGVTTNTRNGDTVKAHHIEMRITVNNVNTSPIFQQVRCIIFRDSSSDGAIPSAVELLEQSGGGYSSILSMPNWDNRYRFKKFYDHVVTLGQNLGSSPTAVFLHRKFKLNRHVTYLATDTSDASLGSGQYYMLLVSTNNNSNSDAPTVAYNVRFGFVDN